MHLESYKSMAMKKKQVGLYMDPALHRRVSLKCLKNGKTLSELIRDLLDAYDRKQIRLMKEI